MAAKRVILTIGHSTLEPDRFIELLRAHGVELLVDVRRFPGSRRVPWTKRAELERLLKASEIDYAHMEALGGRRRPSPDSHNGGWRVAQFQGYADHMETPEFAAGLERLESEAGRRRTAMMCAEAQWWRCHRRLLADALTIRGWSVLHIMGPAAPREHELTEFAEVERGTIRYPA